MSASRDPGGSRRAQSAEPDTDTAARPPAQPVAASPPATPGAARASAVAAPTAVADRPAQASQPSGQPAAPQAVVAEPRSGIIRNAFIGGATVFGLFLSGLASDLLASILSGGAYPAWVERVLNIVGLVIVVALFVVWVVGKRLDPQRPDGRSLDTDLVPPGPPLRPAWFRSRVDLHGRDADVAKALDVVLSRGLVAITGSSGLGSSAVAEEVVHELIARRYADAAHTAPFDLRGWSNESPDDPATIAGRLLSMFGAAEPATADPDVLAGAGRRLRRLLSTRPAVLFLDNLSQPEQIEWLVETWPDDGGPPALVVAGRPEVGAAMPAGCVVPLAPVEPRDLRHAWEDELARARPAVPPLSDPRLDEVFAACAGRPGAVRDLAREVARPDSHWDAGELANLLRTARGSDPRERAWLAVVRRTHYTLSRKGRRLACALAELPVAELTVEAMEAVRHGIDEMETALDDDLHPTPTSPDVDVVDPIQELSHRYLLRQSPVGRYRMPAEVRQAIRDTEPLDDRRAAVRSALPSLVNRYADLAERWGALLDVTEHAGSAARWFQAEEPLLRALLVANYSDEATSAYPEGELLALAVDGLARLADALDRWYVRQEQHAGAQLVHERMMQLADAADRPELVALAATRVAAVLRELGQLDNARAMLVQAEALGPSPGRRVRLTSAFWARHHHERALVHLGQAEQLVDDPIAAAGELVAAERALQQAWTRLPRHDVQGEITTLLTMAAVYLHQRLPDRALDRLDLAETRAQDGADPDGLAHVAELRGAAAWMQGRAPVAVASWQRALTCYDELVDQQGEARCLAHLGSAVLVAPELAGLLVDNARRPLDEVTAVRNALAWLERSQRLRAGQEPSPVAEEYLELARARSVRTSPGWPASSGRASAEASANPGDATDAVPAIDDELAETADDGLPARSRHDRLAREAQGVLRRAMERLVRRLVS